MRLSVEILEGREVPAFLTSAGGLVQIRDDSGGVVQEFRPFEDKAATVPLFISGNEKTIKIGAGVGGAPRLQIRDRESLRVLTDIFVGDPKSRTGVSVAELPDSLKTPKTLTSNTFARHAIYLAFSREPQYAGPPPGVESAVFNLVSNAINQAGLSDLVNVTTGIPTHLRGDRYAVMVIGGVGKDAGFGRAVGTAYVGTYGQREYDPPEGFVYGQGLKWDPAKVALTVLHEWGHLMGLIHSYFEGEIMLPVIRKDGLIGHFNAEQIAKLREVLEK